MKLIAAFSPHALFFFFLFFFFFFFFWGGGCLKIPLPHSVQGSGFGLSLHRSRSEPRKKTFPDPTLKKSDPDPQLCLAATNILGEQAEGTIRTTINFAEKKKKEKHKNHKHLQFWKGA